MRFPTVGMAAGTPTVNAALTFPFLKRGARNPPEATPEPIWTPAVQCRQNDLLHGRRLNMRLKPLIAQVQAGTRSWWL
jgi:hypothetical protein